MTELKADDVDGSLKVGQGQVERSAQRGTATAPRVSCPRVVATHQRFFGHSLAFLPRTDRPGSPELCCAPGFVEPRGWILMPR